MSALTEALVAAQAELPTAIERDSQGQGYRYTSLDKLIAATRPVLSKHGLTITQWPSYEVTPEGLRPTLVTLIGHQESTADYYGSLGVPEGLRFSMPLYVTEKTMQGLGAAITYARRYAWAAALGIASEEDTDGALYTDAEDVPF